MKYIIIFVIASAVGTAGSIINKETPVEYIEFIDPMEISVSR